MTDEEVNEIIGEFMDNSGVSYTWIDESGLVHKELAKTPYTESLDLLVPVLKRIGNRKIVIDDMRELDGSIFVDLDKYRIVSDEWDSISQGLAHTLALVIKELND